MKQYISYFCLMHVQFTYSPFCLCSPFFISLLSLICIGGSAMRFTPYSLPDTTLYFIQAGDQHRENQTWVPLQVYIFKFRLWNKCGSYLVYKKLNKTHTQNCDKKTNKTQLSLKEKDVHHKTCSYSALTPAPAKIALH